MKFIVDIVARLGLFAILFLLMQVIAAWLMPLLSFGDADLGRILAYTLSMSLMIVILRLCNRESLLPAEPIMHSRRGFNPLLILYGVVVTIALSIVLAPLGGYLPEDSREFSDSLWTLVLVVFAAPIFEEVLFRGRLYGLLRTKASPMVSVLLSSLMFGLMHLQPAVMLEGVLMGLLFSYAYLRSRSIFAPVILHMCNNALAYALKVLSYGERPLLELVDSRQYYLVIYAASAVIVVVSFALMIRFMVRYNRRGTKSSDK
ncbi:MAG: CPBP family intramembrane metalloprotease [Alistipes sp.]|nr:CPBP family intramembrane metalloprotease [Alistipes sp.]